METVVVVVQQSNDNEQAHPPLCPHKEAAKACKHAQKGKSHSLHHPLLDKPCGKKGEVCWIHRAQVLVASVMVLCLLALCLVQLGLPGWKPLYRSVLPATSGQNAHGMDFKEPAHSMMRVAVPPACDGELFELTCPEGHIISCIDVAFYGRSDPTQCPHADPDAMLDTGCSLESALDEMELVCLGQQSCRPPAYSVDPCPGTFKWSTATFSCIPVA